MRLYSVEETDIRQALDVPDARDYEEGRQVVLKRFPGRFSGLPLKVVFVEEEGEPIIITAYPLRRAVWRDGG